MATNEVSGEMVIYYAAATCWNRDIPSGDLFDIADEHEGVGNHDQADFTRGVAKIIERWEVKGFDGKIAFLEDEDE